MRKWMAVRAIPSWFGDFETLPTVVVEARSVEDVIRGMRDEAAYPAPVRAVGSRHSTTRCGVADGGTVVLMRGMDRILEIEGDRVTAEAGALYIDISRELAKRGLQFFVNALVNAFYFVIHYAVWLFVRGDRTLPADQTIRYPPQAGNTRYRTDMPHVAYRIARDDGNLLSYSRDEGVITIDPVSTGNPGWPRFLADYNEWCANHGGIPLLNQIQQLRGAFPVKAAPRRPIFDRDAIFSAVSSRPGASCAVTPASISRCVRAVRRNLSG